MNGGELPACSLEDWQEDIRDRLADIVEKVDRIEDQTTKTNGRVTGLEAKMVTANRERLELATQLEVIRSQAIPEIERVVRDVITHELKKRETETDAAAFRAMKDQFGDPVAKMKQLDRIERFLTSTLSKIWILVVTAVTLAIIAVVADKVF